MCRLSKVQLQCILLSLLALATIPFLALFFVPAFDLPRITTVDNNDAEYAWNINDTLSNADSSEARLKGLLPASGASDLTEWLKKDGRGGWCNSLMAREEQCRPVRCLQSPLTLQSIDLTLAPLTVMAGPCPSKALGGQLPYRPDQPVFVSFILTLHNNDVLAAQALLEIFRTAQEVPGSIQFCVYDDGSDQEPLVSIATLSALRRFFGTLITYQRKEVAVGFGEANNIAAQWARGQYIALINTDMFVTRGWISALLFTFSAFPNAGMVGPLYIGEGNLITEAGGIVFRDANAANYGRSFSFHHEFLYARKVDYISAACVLIPARVWQKVGGFDLRYEMGYYEDTDLAMAIRKVGMEVYFQPGSIVYHQEGHTFGSDSPLKTRLMAQNKERFIVKWREQLERDHLPVSGDFQGTSIQRYKGKILWVTQRASISEKDAGSSRARTIAQRMLSKGSHLTLLPLNEGLRPATGRKEDLLEARLLGIDVLDPDPTDLRNEEGGLHSLILVNGACGYDSVMVSGLGLFTMTNRSIVDSCPSVPIVLDLVSAEPSPLIPPQFISKERGAVEKTPKPISNRKIGRIDSSPVVPPTLSTAPQIAAWIKSNTNSIGSEGLTYLQKLSFIQEADSVMISSDLEEQVLKLLLNLTDKPRIHIIDLHDQP